jgi:hypothetical protein
MRAASLLGVLVAGMICDRSVPPREAGKFRPDSTASAFAGVVKSGVDSQETAADPIPSPVARPEEPPVAGQPGNPVPAPTQTPADTVAARLRPNEPPGYLRFAEFAGGELTKEGVKGDGLMAGRFRLFLPRPQNFRVIEDPTAPVSPPVVIQTRFPQGFEAGRGPVSWGGWDVGGSERGQKSKFYLSLWIKIAGNEYENQAVGTKMGMIASAWNPLKGAGTQGILFLNGTGKQRVAREFKVEFHQEFNAAMNPPYHNRHLEQNADRRPLMTCGTWHQWEVVMELNTPGTANGVFRWWIDGTKVIDHSDMTYIFGKNLTGFWQWKWNPTWGGTKGVRTREDLVLIDHVYMSGVPYESPNPPAKAGRNPPESTDTSEESSDSER